MVLVAGEHEEEVLVAAAEVAYVSRDADVAYDAAPSHTWHHMVSCSHTWYHTCCHMMSCSHTCCHIESCHNHFRVAWPRYAWLRIALPRPSLPAAP